MKHFPTRLFVSLLTALFIAFLVKNVSPLTSRARAVAGGSCDWHKVASPSIGGVLWGASALTHTDAWVVGSNGGSGVIEHWDGNSWSFVPSPQPGNYANNLDGIAALSSSDVWAVGSHQNYKGMYQEPQKTLVEHWDGASWSVIASPNVGTFYNSLSAVTALAPNDIWAVGAQGNLQGHFKTLIEHWDGTHWSVVHSPNAGTYANGLSAVTALSSSDIWAVGDDANGKTGARTLIEHWDGSMWSVVPSSSIGTFDNELWSIAGVAPNDIWAVGLYWAAPGNVTDTLTEHWDGSVWSVVSSPNPPGGDNDLHGVAAVASNDVWAVGGSVGGPLTIQWDGHQWNTIPNKGQQSWFLNRIAALNAHDVWAAGSTTTLMQIMHYC